MLLTDRVDRADDDEAAEGLVPPDCDEDTLGEPDEVKGAVANALPLAHDVEDALAPRLALPVMENESRGVVLTPALALATVDRERTLLEETEGDTDLVEAVERLADEDALTASEALEVLDCVRPGETERVPVEEREEDKDALGE